MANNLSYGIKTTRIMDAVAAGTSAQTSTAIDMANFEGCRFTVAFGDITTGAETSVKVQQSSDDASADAYADLEGTSITVADDDDDQLVIVDVWRPRERYLKVVVSRATQNAVIDGVIAEQYGARILPTTDDTATVVAREVHTSPAEGTA